MLHLPPCGKADLMALLSTTLLSEVAEVEIGEHGWGSRFSFWHVVYPASSNTHATRLEPTHRGGGH